MVKSPTTEPVNWWKQRDIDRLKLLARSGLNALELGLILGRSQMSVARKASFERVSLNGMTMIGVRKFLQGDGRVMRDKYWVATGNGRGGYYEHYWTAAHRSSDFDFPTEYMEALLSAGLLVEAVDGKPIYRLKAAHGPA
jgi:hypothetical protein